ncbi:sugar phosphate isomerase/epimerase [Geothrix sp. 21YS21S-4]|uniref:sugar phosphate isomerase/epimerase family protein n=1 Tax=Geothrix sp. 21YS21S-4 TaxID=3068889 RepID=UPI0027BA10FE|nr:TIM barrel protein [Geothrix sp. 21YS21S-4]
MIFVSTSCVRARKIDEAVIFLAEAGFTNIELSGGTQYYPSWKNDLLKLARLYNLTYRCHNYFPPPERHFVLNMASQDQNLRQRSIAFHLDAIRHAADLGSDTYSYHAGFYVEIQPNEIGKPLDARTAASTELAELLYFQGHERVAREGERLGVRLFIENNVLGRANFITFQVIPFMLLTWEDAERLRAKYSFDLLVDLAHLKVTCGSLGLDFQAQARRFLTEAEYVHISDNDGFEDTNDGLLSESDVLEVLAKTRFLSRHITLEVYRDLPTISHSHRLVEGLDCPPPHGVISR